MDESPFYYDMPNNLTIDSVGAQSIDVNTTGNLKSRFTLVVTVRGDGKLLPMMVILKGLKKVPRCHIPENVVVAVNESGTMNSKLMQFYIDHVLRPDLNGKASLLLLDEFKAHSTETTTNRLNELKVTPFMIPGGYTSILQPLDVSINKPLKTHYRDLWLDWYDTCEPQFTKSCNRKKASYETIFSWAEKMFSQQSTRTAMNMHSFEVSGLFSTNSINQGLVNLQGLVE